MESKSLIRFALGICVAAAMVAGCSASQGSIGASGAMPETQASSTHGDYSKLRMLPATSGGALIYAAGGCNGACVLSYPQGQLVSSITIAGGVSGACSDGSGNVFITNNTQVLEYAHGGTTPIATLGLPGGTATGCSVDGITGNLAVVFDGSNKNVAVFAGAQGVPTLYNSHLTSVYCGYDNAGNLFVSGVGVSRGEISELQNGATSFSVLSVRGNLGNPGQVQWDGTYITYQGATTDDIKISRLRVSGSSATIVSTTHIRRTVKNAYQSWIYGDSILIPYSTGGFKVNKIGLWAYPKGGKFISKFVLPGSKSWRYRGVTISAL